MSGSNIEKVNSYVVFARKYRPRTFSDLVGQDTTVRILKNSFSSGKIAHAFMMTGVRGVGKTTTARIIAKGLNCVGPDGTGLPSGEPCGLCENCKMISEGRHVDVLEIDAASRTGVADMRELIDGVFYRAASARYKVYIIDEVHMLSNSAFNALLKTLEEPPRHVKFILATTEIRKIPATVLSRCQKFDLRRIEPEEMIAYLSNVAEKEEFKIDRFALGQISKASEGSMRDALSLLEQVAMNSDEEITIHTVRVALGLADRSTIIDLFEKILEGAVTDSLNLFNSLYNNGADPIIILKDLSEFNHWVTILKISPLVAKDESFSPDERERGVKIADRLSIKILSRLWQLLLKVIEEVSLAPNSKIAAEMGIIRMTYISDMPSPQELIKKMDANFLGRGEVSPDQSVDQQISEKPGGAEKNEQSFLSNEMKEEEPLKFKSNRNKAEVENDLSTPLKTFFDMVKLIRSKRDVELLVEVEDNVRLVNFEPGHVEFQPTESASSELASRLGSFLNSNTDLRWVISLVKSGGGKTLREIKEKEKKALKNKSMENKVVKTIFKFFPGASIDNVITKNSNTTFRELRTTIDNKN